MIPKVLVPGDEFSYLNQWYGSGRWQLMGRSLSYRGGKTYDLLDLLVLRTSSGSVPERFRVPFDTTSVRPPSPAGQAGDVAPVSSSAKWAVPAIFLAAAIGIVYLLKS